MKKFLKITFIALGAMILILLTWIILVLSLYTGVQPYVPDPIYSADGSKVIVPTINFNKDDADVYLLVQFEVQDTKSGTSLFEVQTRASDRMRWTLSWVDDHTVRLDSSDIGSYCWAEANDNVWSETSCP